MIEGDMVRFAFWKELKDVNDWETTNKTHIGVLVEHDTVMKTAKILYEGAIVKVRSQLVEKAGKKDFQTSLDLK